MAELEYAQRLGRCPARVVGSTPTLPIVPENARVVQRQNRSMVRIKREFNSLSGLLDKDKTRPMPQPNLIRLQCTICKRFNYWTRKNIRKVERKIELKKYCKWDRKHTAHKEAKKT